MDSSYKICPSCDAEYLSQFELCATCGVALVYDTEVSDAVFSEPVEPVASPFAGDEELVCIRIAGANWVQRLAERLEAEGIPYRIEMLSISYKGRSKLAARGELPDSVGLSVRPIDEVRATQIDQEHLRREIPGIEELTESTDDSRCPACDTPLSEAEESCAMCGLSFV